MSQVCDVFMRFKLITKKGGERYVVFDDQDPPAGAAEDFLNVSLSIDVAAH